MRCCRGLTGCRGGLTRCCDGCSRRASASRRCRKMRGRGRSAPGRRSGGAPRGRYARFRVRRGRRASGGRRGNAPGSGFGCGTRRNARRRRRSGRRYGGRVFRACRKDEKSKDRRDDGTADSYTHHSSDVLPPAHPLAGANHAAIYRGAGQKTRFESKSIVTGPSLTSSSSIDAPKMPYSTGTPNLAIDAPVCW